MRIQINQNNALIAEALQQEGILLPDEMNRYTKGTCNITDGYEMLQDIMKNHHPRLFVYSQELIPQIPHMDEQDWDYTRYLMRVRSDTIIRGMMDLHPKTINDKMFQLIFVENLNPKVKDKIRERMMKDLASHESRIKRLYDPLNFFLQMNDLFIQYSAKYKNKIASSSKSISRSRTKTIPQSSSRSLVPSQQRQIKGNSMIPTPIRAVNQSSCGEVEQVLTRLFLMDILRLDENLRKELFELRNGLLALRNDYNRYDKQPCIICGNEHKFEDCEVLKCTSTTAEIAKKVFLFFNSLKRYAKRNNINDLNQLRNLSSAAINQVGYQPTHLSVQLLEAAQNPLGLLPNASTGVNSIHSQFQLNQLPFDSNFASINQVTNLPINDTCYDTSISSQGSSASLHSINHSWTGIDNGDISSIESAPTDTSESTTDFQWAGS